MELRSVLFRLLPPDITALNLFCFLCNPLTMFVFPEFLADTTLAGDVAFLQGEGIPVSPYPLSIELLRIRQPIGAFQFAITGPPGVYTILASADLASWSPLFALSNNVGAFVVTDGTAHLTAHKFYRAQLQTPPMNMVF